MADNEDSNINKDDKQNELSILFPEMEIEGYKIKAWSLGKLERIAPHLEKIIQEIRLRKLKLSELLTDPTGLLLALIGDVAPIISITLGEKIEVVREFALERSVKIALVIAQQNVGYLKNVLIPLQKMLIAMQNMRVDTAP